MATAPLTFGDRLTAAGLTWEVSDAVSYTHLTLPTKA